MMGSGVDRSGAVLLSFSAPAFFNGQTGGNKLSLETIGVQIWCARKYAELWRLGSDNFPLDIIMDSWYTDLKMLSWIREERRDD